MSFVSRHGISAVRRPQGAKIRGPRSALEISVRTDPKGSGEVSESGDGTCKVGPRACDPQCAEIKLAAPASRGGFLLQRFSHPR
jgi:hypothetical protein